MDTISSDSSQSNVISLLNSLSNATDQTTKCDLIAKLQEFFIVYKPEQENWLNDILSHSHDASSDVRKVIVGFVYQVW